MAKTQYFGNSTRLCAPSAKHEPHRSLMSLAGEQPRPSPGAVKAQSDFPTAGRRGPKPGYGSNRADRCLKRFSFQED